MGFDSTLTKPLAQIYTYEMIINQVIQVLRKESTEELNPDLLQTMLNSIIIGKYLFILANGGNDYRKTLEITDQSSSRTASIVSGASASDNTINKTSHGLTSSSIGKRISLITDTTEISTPEAIISTITEIVDDDYFNIEHSFNSDHSGTIRYAVFSNYAQSSYDLSSLRLNFITKIEDSVNGEVRKASDLEFTNLSRFPEKQKAVYYNQQGQTLFFKLGSSISSLGTLKMFFVSYPQLSNDSSQKMDIKDFYADSLIYELINQAREYLNMPVDQGLAALIESKNAQTIKMIEAAKAQAQRKNEDNKI